MSSAETTPVACGHSEGAELVQQVGLICAKAEEQAESKKQAREKKKQAKKQARKQVEAEPKKKAMRSRGGTSGPGTRSRVKNDGFNIATLTRIVQDVLSEQTEEELRVSKDAMLLLKDLAEVFLEVKYCQGAHAAAHANRLTVGPADIKIFDDLADIYEDTEMRWRPSKMNKRKRGLS
jgi:histone H3/H4